MGFLSGNINKINLYDDSFYENDPKTIIYVRILAQQYRYKQRKGFKKEISKELMIVAWHAIRWWDWCMTEDEKKEIESIYL